MNRGVGISGKPITLYRWYVCIVLFYDADGSCANSYYVSSLTTLEQFLFRNCHLPRTVRHNLARITRLVQRNIRSSRH